MVERVKEERGNGSPAPRGTATALREAPVQATAEGPSLRRWLRQLEENGQLKRIKTEVDWDQEIGGLARINLSLDGPGLLFENIKDYQAGRCTKFFTCGIGNRSQVCLMVGLPLETSDKDLVRHLKEVFQKPIPPVMVDTGPVKENAVRGAEA